MKNYIPFNKPSIAGRELYYIAQAILRGHSSGDGPFTTKCQELIQSYLNTPKALLTQSYSSALDMAAILSNVGPGDEVIMPSFAFASVANAFHMRGATPVFVDIRPDTLNIDEKNIVQAVTQKTKVIVTPHYSGVGCDMEVILDIASQHNLLVIEDAANGFGSRYGIKYLGTMGDLGLLSFHETNSIMCGEGGALLVNNERFKERSEIIREKGTNRSKFFRGEIDKYTWVDIGSSFLPSDLVAAFLYAQLEMVDKIIDSNRHRFRQYIEGLKKLSEAGDIRLPMVYNQETNASSIMYLISGSIAERNKLINYLNQKGINTVFHYSPLHSSPMGKKYGRVHGELTHTVQTSERLIRLPLFFDMNETDLNRVIEAIIEFYK